MWSTTRVNKTIGAREAGVNTRESPVGAIRRSLVLLVRACVAKFPTLSRPFLPYPALPRLFRPKDFDEICPKSRKLANESKTFQDPLAGVYGSLVNNIMAFVTLKSFDGQ